MKHLICTILSVALITLIGCSTSSHQAVAPASVRSGVTGTSDPDQVFMLEHDHFPEEKKTNRLERISWTLKDANHNKGALRNQPVGQGQILEWRAKNGTKGTNFCIALPRTTDPSWTPADPAGGNHPWYYTLGSQFPPDYQAINAWPDQSGDFVVRLLLTWSTTPTDPIHYLIVVPQFDDQHKAVPYDYYMVDATLVPVVEQKQ